MWWTASFEPQWVVSLLPPQSSTPLENIFDLGDGDLVARDPVALIPSSRSDTGSPLAWLPYLADERSVDEFSGSWPEARQRAVVRESLPIHQVKGTRPAIDRVLASMGYQAQVVEWFEEDPPRYPNTFRLTVYIDQDREWFDTDNIAMIRAANKAKNLHTKLDVMAPIRRSNPAPLYIGGLARYTEVLRVGSLPEVAEFRISGTVFIGAIVRINTTLRIQPRT